jgi:hypothetical protein
MTIRWNISGKVSDDVHRRIKGHPVRGRRTLSEFYEYIFQQYLDSPATLVAILERRLTALERKLSDSERIISGLRIRVGRLEGLQSQARTPEPSTGGGVAA